MDEEPTGDLSSFGYRFDDRQYPREVLSVQVAEGKNNSTLAPTIVMYFRFDENEEQIGFVLPLELAEALTGELGRWTRRAREKDFR